MIVQAEISIQESRINQKSNNTVSVMHCTRSTFVKKNSCLVARIVTFDIAEAYPSKDIELDLSHVI